MIEYKEDYIFLLLFRLKGSVACRSLRYAVPSALLALLLVYIDEWSPSFRYDLGLMDITNSQLWSASIGVITILLAFRTNRAMARFWEGTGLLHQMRGEWFDSVSCCVTFTRAALATKRLEVMQFRHTIVRLMSLCHGSALQEIAGSDADECETIDSFGLDNATLAHLKDCAEVHHFNRVEVLLHLIQSLITKNLDDQILKIAPPILSRVYQTLSRGFVNLLNAKKIADTRFPFPYVQLITLLLYVHVLVTPMMISSIVPSKVFAPIFTLMPIFGMFALNFIGVELENPFGDDDNDLPLGHFQAEMNKCLLLLLQDNADLIPSISPSRCITDFAKLKSTMRPSHVNHEGLHMGEVPQKRISQFMDVVDIHEDETILPGKLSSAISKNGEGKKSVQKKVSVVDPPETPCRAPPEVLIQPEPDQRGAKSSEPEPKTLDVQMLSKSLEVFSASLEDLKRSAEAQAGDLRRSITAVTGFREQLPVLLDTIPSDSKPSRWRRKHPDSPEFPDDIGRVAAAVEEVRAFDFSEPLPRPSGPAPQTKFPDGEVGQLDARDAEPAHPTIKPSSISQSLSPVSLGISLNAGPLDDGSLRP